MNFLDRYVIIILPNKPNIAEYTVIAHRGSIPFSASISEFAKNAILTDWGLGQCCHCSVSDLVCLATIGVAFLSAVTSVAALFYFLQKEGKTMKKAISLLLALVMCLSLCACGGNKSDNGNMSVNAPAIYIGTPETIGDKVEFDNLVLAENDIAKIMLVEFYVDKLYGSGNSDGAKCAIFKVENKTEHEMSVWVTPYLDNERISLANIEGSSTIEAGRVGRLGYYFTFGEYPNATDLESMEDLYNLEFTFELKDMSNFENNKVNCSVADALKDRE